MKQIFLSGLLLMVAVSIISAQSVTVETIDLQWEQKASDNFSNINGPLVYYGFEGEELDATAPGIIRHTIRVPLNGNGEINVEVVPQITSDIDMHSSLAVRSLTDEWQIEYYISQIGLAYEAVISVIPIKKSKGGFLKLDNYDIVLTYTPVHKGISTRDLEMTTTSNLSSGTLYKLAIPKEGVYRITGKYLEDKLGIDLGNLNSSTIQLFGNEGGRLPQNTSTNQPDDVSEIPLQIFDGNDGNLGADDYFLFYAEGADKWNYNAVLNTYLHQKNVFDVNNYVFLKIDGITGKRVTIDSGAGNAEYDSDTYDYLQIHEDERVNLLGAYSSTEGTGKDWYGEYFALETTQNFEDKFDISDLASDGEAKVAMHFAARSSSTTRVYLTVNDQEFDKSASGTNLSDIESRYANRVGFREDIILSDGDNSIDVRYDKSSSEDEGWLDYIQLEYRKVISGKYSQVRVSDKMSLDYDVSSLASPSGVTVWDVTDVNNTSIMSPSNGRFTYESSDDLRIFYYTNGSDFPEPMAVGQIENQNLHAIDQADLVIVYYSEFEMAANRLADHRRNYSNYTVSTVDVEQIYNEFSSGRADPTAIRDFARMLHVRDLDFRYLLLLGDGSYDFRGVTPNLSDHNFIPVYETDESLHPIDGFPSDDYYALLSDGEGENKLKGGLDIGVGRIPVTTAEMANDVINKIINYDINKSSFGDWRLRIGFSADDEDSNLHVNQADALAEDVEVNNSEYNQTKVYFDSYVQESTPGGDRYPGASDAINRAVQNGILVLNYMGHGGPKGWSQERVLKKADIDTWNNADQLPILITATCSFTGYDDPALVSAGESAIQKKNGGVVALFTTVRAVYASANEKLARAVYDKIFQKVDGRPQTIGDIMMRAKNSTTSTSGTTNDRKFALIGDPSQSIAIPTFNIETTEINGNTVTNVDTISALEQVTIKGRVTNEIGALISDFNGQIFPTVFDKESTLETLANDPKSSVKQFGVYRNILFKGAATVKNGEFEFSFIMPKDINYEFGTGRISYYAYDGSTRDAAGNFNNVIVGGTSPNIIADDEGPEIDLFMNDDKFIFGGVTNADPILIVNLTDDFGINVSGTSIGHDITAVLDDDKANIFILNSFYKANVDDFTSGVVRFPLQDLEPGRHSIVVKAWDVSNNSAESRIEFIVAEQEGEELRNVINYPNPFSGATAFSFEHDLVGSDLDVAIDIYSATGQHVTTLNTNVASSNYKVDNILWNANRDAGPGVKAYNIMSGIYFYKIRVTSRELNQYRESNFQKLIMID